MPVTAEAAAPIAEPNTAPRRDYPAGFDGHTFI
jgi:hypothetical protein